MSGRETPFETTAALADRVAATQHGVARPVVVIDGRSGSGKTTLAPLVAERLGAQLVRLDDVYPGWDGLEAASRAVVDDILGPEPGYRGWDWVEDRPTTWTALDPARPIVIEGSGSLSRRARELATGSVWLELDAAERKRRALARDGDRYAPHWERWAAQEDAFLARERPDLLAEIVVDASRIAI